VNEVLPYLAFVEKQPVGSKVKGVVDSYSAHGAYVKVGDIKGYVPLRLLGNPAPRSAREAIQIGDTLALVVAGYTPARRSVELGVPEAVKIAVKETKVKASAKVEKKEPVSAKKAAAVEKKVAPVAKKAAVPKKAAAVVKKAAAAVKKAATPAKKSGAKKASAPAKAVSKATKK
jgi:ribosomal protein S1